MQQPGKSSLWFLIWSHSIVVDAFTRSCNAVLLINCCCCVAVSLTLQAQAKHLPQQCASAPNCPLLLLLLLLLCCILPLTPAMLFGYWICSNQDAAAAAALHLQAQAKHLPPAVFQCDKPSPTSNERRERRRAGFKAAVAPGRGKRRAAGPANNPSDV
jgi:hypothetical protein